MVTKIFWTIFVLDLAGIAVLAYLASRGPSSPEGPVGGWLIFIPPILMAAVAGAVLITRSDAVKMAGIYILGFPLVAIVIGPIYSAYENDQTNRRIAGDDDFHGPQRKLAHAIKARDAALAKTLIPIAGDLNRQYGDDTLLHFAVYNSRDLTVSSAPTPPASLDIVQALLAAGARAEQPDKHQRWPLSGAISTGPEPTEMLLKAGANPNHLDESKRPLWWGVLSDDTDRGFETLKVLLDHGADLTLKDGEGGPVAWASYNARARYYSGWRLVWLLVERGAPWKGEQEFGQPVTKMLAEDFERREGPNKLEISEEMRQLREKFRSE